MTPLHWAVAKGSDSIVTMLIAAKAIIDAKEISGKTPIDTARGFKRTSIVSILTNAGAK